MLSNLIKAKNKSHAILIVKNRLCDLHQFLIDYFQSIINDLPIDLEAKAAYCLKIKENKYADLIYLNGSDDTIKKNDIQTVIQKFFLTAYEQAGIKFYVLDNVEKTTSQALNSLLKFLEEPPINTYAVITCKNINMVLETIKSRCQIYNLTTNWQNVDQLFKKHRLDETERKICLNLYDDLKDLQNDLESKAFKEKNRWSEILINNQNNFKELKNLFDTIKTISYQFIYDVIKICIYKTNKKQELLNVLESLKFNLNKLLIINKVISIINE